MSTRVLEVPRTYERQRTLMFLLMRGFLAKLDIDSVNKGDYLGLLTIMSRPFSYFDILERDVTVHIRQSFRIIRTQILPYKRSTL